MIFHSFTDHTLAPRMWTLSLLFAFLGSGTNLFFSLRYPSISITPVIALLLVHPLGILWDKFLKRSSDQVDIFVAGTRVAVSASEDEARTSSSKRERLRLWLGQGNWNEKEHSCVYISSNVSFGFAFATDVSIDHFTFRIRLIIYHR
jgi:OPT oligopeptide transporter protein